MRNSQAAIAFIFARGGSKGLPGKNIRPFAGKPLIAWAIAHAKAVGRVRRVIVSTDSQEIASVAKAHGAEVPFMRPPELAEDASPEWLAWRHALEFVWEEEGALPWAMLSVPTTAPLRLVSDIDRAIDLYAQGDADVVVSVAKAHRNPYFNMVAKDHNDTVGLVIPPPAGVSRRQDAPEVFDMTTVVYCASPLFVLEHTTIFEGRVKAIEIPVERSIDIDTQLDFEMAKFLFQRSENKS
jgi:CMP-N-acetylneuraminic acid synthetase